MPFRVLCLFLYFSLGIAQSFPSLQGFIATDSQLLDQNAITQAAQRLESRGVRPLVLFVEGDVGDSLDEASAYFDKALEAYGLINNGVAPEYLFALFVGTNPLPESANQRPIYIAYGPGLVPTLKTLAGSQDVDAFIRNDLMIPKLLDGNFTGAFTSSMLSLAERLPLPETSLPETIVPPTTVAIPDWQSLLKNYGWLALPVLALLGAVGLRRAGKHKAKKIQGDQHLKEIYTSIQNDLDELEASLPADMTKQSEMLLLSELIKEAHPEEWQQLVTGYEKARSTREAVQHQLQSSQADPQRYEVLQAQLAEVKTFRQLLNDKWQLLHQEVMSIPDRLTALRGSLQQLRIGYFQRADFPSADEVFKPLEEDIRDIEYLHQNNKALSALKLLNQSQTHAMLVSESMTRLMQTDYRLDEFERMLPTYQQQGFKLYQFSESLGDIRGQFAIALGLVRQGEYKVLDAQVDEVEEQVNHVVDGSKTLIELHRSNQQALEHLQTTGEELKALIVQASDTFDKVDDFAPSCWRDIEGNGSEAQVLAERAFDAYEQALEANALEGPQDFETARALIQQGQEALEQARILLQAIEDRLKHLEEARQTARSQLDLVKQDLTQHAERLGQPQTDREVGPRADQLLSQTSQLIEKVNLELDKAQPNWLWVMETIQAADQIADEALEVIRSEQEAMTHRRLRLSSEKVEAQSALGRLRNYMQSHHAHLSMQLKDALQESETLFRGAQELERQALTQSEIMLAQTLEQAAAMFDQSEQKATLAFSQAELEVQQALEKEAEQRRREEAPAQDLNTRTYVSAPTRSYSSPGLRRSYSSRSSSSSYARPSPSRPGSSRSKSSWGGGGRKSGGGW